MEPTPSGEPRPGSSPLRVHLHDFGCYPFPVELSRALAARGHDVTHTYAEHFAGRSVVTTDGAESTRLRFAPVTVRRGSPDYAPHRRVAFERAFGAALVARLRAERPDVVVTANLPLFAAARLTRYVRRSGLPWLLWHQDVVSLAVGDEAERRLPAPVARGARALAEAVERRALRAAAAVVPIGEAFVEQYARWGLRPARVEVVPNWAPLDDIRPRPRDGAWARGQGLRETSLRLLYAGTLGRKHNPDLLADLVRELRGRGVDAEMVVVSEGEGADRVARRAADEPGLRVLPYQEASQLPDVLAAGDVLVALLEPGASQFSIPSKVLTYFAAGRPVLGFVPATNAAARDIERAGGAVVTPDGAGVRRAADWLAGLSADPARVAELGRRSRALAEDRFALDGIADRFESVLREVARSGTARRR